MSRPSSDRRITSFIGSGGEFDPSWSPDGTRIAFGGRLDESDDFEIWSISPDGSNRVQLTEDDDDTAQPDWSPDNATIVYAVGNDEAGYDLWSMDADGANAALLLDTGGSEESPVYSPDGTKIAFGVYDGTMTNVWLADADGSNAAQLTTGYDFTPNWQPVAPAPTTTTTVAPSTPTTAPRPTPVAAAIAVRPSFTG
jgi:TolB protein